jgi:CopG family transcriptional regulator, nickel-responsive regulator
MERFTISLDKDLARQFDALLKRKGYRNRSEAVRDMLRGDLESARLDNDESLHCVAALSYVYNHHVRALAERLTSLQHDNHDLVLSSMHVHLDHDNCLETVILRGKTKAVRAFANSLIAEPEVRHGQINLISVDVEGGNVRSYKHVNTHGHSHPRT